MIWRLNAVSTSASRPLAHEWFLDLYRSRPTRKKRILFFRAVRPRSLINDRERSRWLPSAVLSPVQSDCLLSTNENMFQNLKHVEIKTTPPMNSFFYDLKNRTLYTRHVCPSDRKHSLPNIIANKSQLISYKTIIIFNYGSAFKANALSPHLRSTYLWWKHNFFVSSCFDI